MSATSRQESRCERPRDYFLKRAIPSLGVRSRARGRSWEADEQLGRTARDGLRLRHRPGQERRPDVTVQATNASVPANPAAAVHHQSGSRHRDRLHRGGRLYQRHSGGYCRRRQGGRRLCDPVSGRGHGSPVPSDQACVTSSRRQALSTVRFTAPRWERTQDNSCPRRGRLAAGYHTPNAPPSIRMTRPSTMSTSGNKMCSQRSSTFAIGLRVATNLAARTRTTTRARKTTE